MSVTCWDASLALLMLALVDNRGESVLVSVVEMMKNHIKTREREEEKVGQKHSSITNIVLCWFLLCSLCVFFFV